MVTSSIKISEPTLEAVMRAQARTFSLPCFTDELVCFRSWADPFFLHTLAFPSHWFSWILVLSIKLCSRTFVAHLCTSVRVILPSNSYYQWEFWILWYSLYIAALQVFFERWLRHLHPCSVKIVCEVTDWCFGFEPNIAQEVELSSGSRRVTGSIPPWVCRSVPEQDT